MAFNLYPPPRKFRQQKSSLDLHQRRWLVLDASVSNRLRLAATRFANENPRDLAVTFGTPPPDHVLVSLHCRRMQSEQEGYQITCNQQGIQLQADSDIGLFYGLGTLKQLLAQANLSLPCFKIEDEPDFPRRGVMLDVSRSKVPTLDTLFTQIDHLAELKYNQLQLYIEHTFAFVNHSIVWGHASPLTPDDILKLQAYCHDRFIDLVPNLNSFGHFERWLKHPEYRHYAECPDGFTHPLSGEPVPWGSTLKPAPDSLKLLEELYDEFLPLFRADHFNIGGDEPWELGQGWSRELCESSGKTGVYLDFLGRIQKLVNARNRRMMFWSDIVLQEPGSLNTLSADVTVLNWGYEAQHPFSKECKILADAGLPFYVCPGTSAWNSLTGRTGNLLHNLTNASRNGLKFGATGLLVTDWGDHGHHQYPPVSYQGFVMGGCHAWNHSGARRLDPADGISRIYFRDETAKSGELIVELGKTPDLVTADVRNGTLFNRLLFWDMANEPHVAEKVTAAELNHCLDVFADLEGALVSQAAERPLLHDELESAIRMAKHGIHRLQYFRGDYWTRSDLRAELMAIIDGHEALWMARNRPGGLGESVAYLERSLLVL